VRNGDLTFLSGGITVHATGTYNGNVAAVVQDKENAYNKANKIGAGLGVYHKTGDTADDNVTFGEVLTLTFEQLVRIDVIQLASEGHNVLNWQPGTTFLLTGVDTPLPVGVGTFSPVGLTGTSFSFAFGDSKADQFYLNSLTVTAVPEPQTYAMLLAGLAAMGFVARRRQPR
jgi:hypothetical protein